MKPIKPLQRQRGFLFLVFVVTIAVAGTAGALTIKAIQDQQAPIDNVMNKLASDQPVSDQEMDAAVKARNRQFQIAGAGASLVNAVEVSPNAGSVVSAYGGGCIDIMVQQGSNPARPLSSSTLPTDVSSPAIPGCTTGKFTCANGTVICADKVCNGANNCGDSSDEASALCNTPRSCCQVTNGCPGETGSSCASSCCCCPWGQVCDRTNPARGCVAAN